VFYYKLPPLVLHDPQLYYSKTHASMLNMSPDVLLLIFLDG